MEIFTFKTKNGEVKRRIPEITTNELLRAMGFIEEHTSFDSEIIMSLLDIQENDNKDMRKLIYRCLDIEKELLETNKYHIAINYLTSNVDGTKLTEDSFDWYSSERTEQTNAFFLKWIESSNKLPISKPKSKKK